MKLGYVHFDSEQQRKCLAVLSNMSSTAIDELGLGRIRDCFSDMLFPGTSSLQQHAKYFVLMPLVYKEAAKGQYHSVAEVKAGIIELEKKLTQNLYDNSEIKTGITGSDYILTHSKGFVKYDPMYIYNTGMIKFGILKEGRVEHHIMSRSDFQFCKYPPDMPENWLECADLELSASEASFLIRAITTSPQTEDSLLAFILNADLDLDGLENLDDFQKTYDEVIPVGMNDVLKKAIAFSRFTSGLYCRYNYLYSGRTDIPMLEKFNNFVEECNELYRPVTDGLSSLVFHDNGSRTFCNEALKSIMEKDFSGLDFLLVQRERNIKQERSKIGNPSYPYDCKNPIHNYRLSSRWDTVHTILSEILKGMHHGK